MASTQVSVDLDQFITPEQRHKLAQEVWNENQETIKNNIRKAIHHELQRDVAHRVRALLEGELETMIKDVLQERLPKTRRHIALIAGFMLNDERLGDAIAESTTGHLDSALARLGDAVKQGVGAALSAGLQRYFEERGARRAREVITHGGPKDD